MPDDKDLAQQQLQDNLLPIGVYRHYKGGMYIVYAMSLEEETLKPLVHYYSISHRTRWTRFMENFQSPRFEYDRAASVNELLEAVGLSRIIGDELLGAVHAVLKKGI